MCEPVSGEGHDAHWHFKVEPLMPVKKSSFYLRVGEEEAVIDPLAAPSRATMAFCRFSRWRTRRSGARSSS